MPRRPPRAQGSVRSLDDHRGRRHLRRRVLLPQESRHPGNADELLPITVFAVRFGRRGGAGAIISLTAVFGCELRHPMADLTPLGYTTRVIAFLMTGLLIGSFVDRRRRLEGELLGYFDDSLDLLATAGRDGCLRRVNPAWEVALGRTRAELCSRPLVSFIHPEDRSAAAAGLSALLRSPASIRACAAASRPRRVGTCGSSGTGICPTVTVCSTSPHGTSAARSRPNTRSVTARSC